jgi:predicted NAD/FAD-dependent oxidoreductase
MRVRHFASVLLWAAASGAEYDADVIVIGAGWSGMGAAIELAKKNVSFLVLEARDYTGGRTHAVQFGDENVWRGTFEEGSNWVCGVNRKADAPLDAWQPVHEIAKSMPDAGLAGDYPGFATARVRGSTQNMPNYRAVYDAQMSPVDPDGSLRAHANAVVDCMNATAMTQKKDVSAADALAACGWVANTPAELALQARVHGDRVPISSTKGWRLRAC